MEKPIDTQDKVENNAENEEEMENVEKWWKIIYESNYIQTEKQRIIRIPYCMQKYIKHLFLEWSMVYALQNSIFECANLFVYFFFFS